MDKLQELLIIDALLTNWQTIRRLFAQDSDEAGLRELSAIGVRLADERIEGALDDLSDLLEDTAADTFFADLIKRHLLSESLPRFERSAPSEAPTASVARMCSQDSKVLAFEAAAEPGDTHTHVPVPLFFATNREKIETASSETQRSDYSGEHASALNFGVAVVTIPVATHETGKVEVPAWWNLHCDPSDKNRFMVLDSVDCLEQSSFVMQLGRTASLKGADDLLVFMHGYNVSFEEAAIRAAQVAYDLSFVGTAVLFSWPSLARVVAYTADEARAAASGESLTALLKLLEGGPWRNIHLMAHSMGNRVLLSSLADNPLPSIPLGQVVMVAADVNEDLFRIKHPKMAGAGKLLTSYVSATDRALFISRFLHQKSCIGHPAESPFVSPGMETIDATSINTSFLGLGLGHSYFSDKRSMLTDLGYLLQRGLPANQRKGLRPSSDNTYWIFPK